MGYYTEIPTAKALYARRLSDNQELFVTSGYVKNGMAVGVNAVTIEGERIVLLDGEYTLFRK
ncbi:hypothetical protein QU593_10000 [Rossellomorea marisflavi]|uniref:hypothetical protein n=1 Tax=Rossellomorea marisflavi TaxID=189381 RepID=UPI0025AF1188|nr:hypothetical protein [Rossellomorea marisflavi]WJV20736.1 hypothetical protein QU593_10000 [Rossellomorea marisflavi]